LPDAGGAILAPPHPGVRYPCPCCGYPTLMDRGGFEVCWVCYWEDDGQDDPYADQVWGGPNGSLSLSEAREKYEQDAASGKSYEVPAFDTPVMRRIMSRIFETYSEMLYETEETALLKLWESVLGNEQAWEREAERAWKHQPQVRLEQAESEDWE
jgi:hypothetical protein